MEFPEAANSRKGELGDGGARRALEFPEAGNSRRVELSEGIRAFIAIDLDSAVRTAVSAVLAALRQQRLADEVRWVSAEALHMTLRFLGKIGPEQVAPLARQVSAELESIEPFEMLLGAVHLFPSARRPRVVALGVGPLAPLEALAAAVERGTRVVGFEPEERRFRAHLTLGRLRGRRGPETGDFSVPDGTAVTVSDTVLFQSVLGRDGAKYTPLERMQLGKPGGRSSSSEDDHP